jgi:SAM-dependent methyltransferase
MIMEPQQTGARYDKLARWWQTAHQSSAYGITALEQAIKFVATRQYALDVGCGSSGRFISTFVKHGFQAEGVDISSEMINCARRLQPDVMFYTADIAQWLPPKPYSLITAWDSTFHLPLSMQEPVLQKLSRALAPNGVLLFTCGGGHTNGEVTGSFGGQDFAYSTLGVNAFLQILHEQGCTCRQLEYDQYPENHVYIIAQKVE